MAVLGGRVVPNVVTKSTLLDVPEPTVELRADAVLDVVSIDPLRKSADVLMSLPMRGRQPVCTLHLLQIGNLQRSLGTLSHVGE